MTLDAFLVLWVDRAARPRLDAGTLRDYRALLDRFVRPALGGRSLLLLTPLDLQGLYAGMSDRGLTRSIRYTHAVVHSALEAAVGWRYIDRNPADGVELPRMERTEMTALSVEQVGRLLRGFRRERDEILVLFAVTTGLRPGEYLAAKWSDLHDGALFVQRALSRGPAGGFKEPKRARSRRAIRLLPTVLRALARQRVRLKRLRIQNQRVWRVDLDLIFPAPDGRPDNPKALSHRFARRARGIVGLPRIRLYDLRHTAATLMLAAGIPVKLVSEQLGHASAAFTLDVYSHVLTSMADVATRKVERLLFGR